MTTKTTENLISPEAIAEIRSIVEGIKSGKYAHDQMSFLNDEDSPACGTAHCIAGWKVHLDYDKSELEFESLRHLFYLAPSALNDLYVNLYGDILSTCLNAWEYAQHAWGLEHEQASSLFAGDLSISEIESNLDYLETHCSF